MIVINSELPHPSYEGDISFRMGVGGGDIVQVTLDIDGQIYSQVLKFHPRETKQDIFKKIAGTFDEWSKL